MTWRTHTLVTAIRTGDPSSFEAEKELPFDLRLVAIRCNLEPAGIFSVSIVLTHGVEIQRFVEKADPSTLARLMFDNPWPKGLIVRVEGAYAGMYPSGYSYGYTFPLTFDFFGETK